VLPVPVTFAKNWHVLVEPPEAGTKAYVGEIVTPTVPDDAEIVIVEIPVREASAWLVAVASIVTGFVPGRLVGAVYVALSAPVVLIVPMLEFPLAIPLTSHVTLALAARQNEAANDCG
jgi:hypothetical protein